LSEAGMGNPETGEDAAPVTPAHVVAHGGRDGIRPPDVPLPVSGGVAAQHGRRKR
jgi:hypothetical protein